MAIDFKGAHFPKSVILHAVFFYVRYPVSYRDLQEILAERGVVSQIFHQVKSSLIFRRNYAASSAKTSNGERLSLANWFLRIICATSMPAIVAEAE